MSAARLGVGVAVIAATVVGFSLGGTRSVDEFDSTSLGVERVVAEEGPVARTGLATVALNRPSAPVGDPERAIDAEHVIALAGPAATPTDTVAAGGPWFLVGDSTFTAAAAHLGMGSAYPGVGFALAPFVGATNPLDLPPPGFDGTVVIGVSIWDAPITDAAAYIEAVDRYRVGGHPVLVVEVPERFGPGDAVVTTPAEERELHALNRLVADGLGCALVPWSVRDVETLGDVDGGDDHVHPTAAGVTQLVDNLARLADHACWPTRPATLR